jgi:hypothetical protein
MNYNTDKIENSHLLLRFSGNRILVDDLESEKKIVYDNQSQVSIYKMGGPSTSCHKVTNGTQPKNEADRIMDDN